MATISERLAYILTFDTTQGVRSLQQLGSTADKELGKAEAKLDKLGSNMSKFGAGAMAFAGIAGAGLFKMASGAADAEANMSALEQVVGTTVAHQVGEWAEDSAKGVGMASKDAVAAATSFAQLGKIIGLGGEDLSKFSTDLVGLSADFAAFKNVAPEQALQDVQAAFAGSTEVMRKYGIFLDDATLKTAYFRETGEKVTGTLTAQQKIVAINAEMYRQGGDMIGQWSRESGELQGQLATMRANLTNLSDEIGAGVLPHLMSLVSVSTSLISTLSSADSATNGLIGTIATFGVGALALGGSISFVIGKLILMRAQITALATRFPRTMSAMTAAAAPLAVAFVGLAMHARDAAKDAAALTATLGELSRASDAEILDQFNRALLQSVVEGNGVNKMLDELVRTQLGAAERIVATAKAKGEETEITKLLEEALAKEKVARENAAVSAEVEAEATEADTVATEENTEAKAALAESAAEARQRIEDLTSTMLAAAGQVHDLEEAEIALQDSVDELADAYLTALGVVEDSEATDREKAAAVRDTRSAQIDAAAQALALAEAYAAEKGAADGTVESGRLQVEKLREMQEKYPELRDDIQLYIDKLLAVPGVVDTTISADTRAANASLDELLRKLATIGSNASAGSVLSANRFRQSHTGSRFEAGEAAAIIPNQQLFVPDGPGRMYSPAESQRMLASAGGSTKVEFTLNATPDIGRDAAKTFEAMWWKLGAR